MFHFRGPWTSFLLCFRLRYRPGHAARHSDMPDHRQAGLRRIDLLHQRGRAFAVTCPYLRRIGSQPTSHKDSANHGRAGPARGPVDYMPDRLQQPHGRRSREHKCGRRTRACEAGCRIERTSDVPVQAQVVTPDQTAVPPDAPDVVEQAVSKDLAAGNPPKDPHLSCQQACGPVEVKFESAAQAGTVEEDGFLGNPCQPGPRADGHPGLQVGRGAARPVRFFRGLGSDHGGGVRSHRHPNRQVVAARDPAGAVGQHHLCDGTGGDPGQKDFQWRLLPVVNPAAVLRDLLQGDLGPAFHRLVTADGFRPAGFPIIVCCRSKGFALRPVHRLRATSRPSPMLQKHIGIDLGTVNVLVHVQGKGIVMQEPSVVAIAGQHMVAVGHEAFDMLGRNPDSIQVERPLLNGVIAKFDVTEAMLRYFIQQVTGKRPLFKPRVMISTPKGVTSVEEHAVHDAAMQAGAGAAYLIPEPLAAAYGAGLPIGTPTGNMVVDFGGGTTESAVVSMYDIVVWSSVRTGGNRIDEAIANYVRKKYNLLIGEQTAEEIKISIGSALPQEYDTSIEIRGRDQVNGLPRSASLASSEVTEAIEDPMQAIIGTIRSTLEKTPPELASDIIDRGVVLTGGGSQLRYLPERLTRHLGVPCYVAENPMACVALGAGQALENYQIMRRSIPEIEV